MSVNDSQVGGIHYKTVYQHWDFVRLALNGRYLEGCVTKYISRWKKKNGLQDLKKAQHYLEKLIDGYGMGAIQPIGCCTLRIREATTFAVMNDLGPYERAVVVNLAAWGVLLDLRKAQQALAELIRDVEIAELNHEESAGDP
jgi:hypothetical protein